MVQKKGVQNNGLICHLVPDDVDWKRNFRMWREKFYKFLENLFSLYNSRFKLTKSKESCCW